VGETAGTPLAGNAEGARLPRRYLVEKTMLGDSEQKKGPHDPVISFSIKTNANYSDALLSISIRTAASLEIG
jgi:hypothetical protein